MYDIIIVGAGPAGLTAALYALRANKKVLVIEAMTYGGQIINARKIENYPGIQTISGFDFANNLYNQVNALGMEYKNETVIRINEDKSVITNKNTYTGKAIIIASGASHKRLKIDNEEELTGKGISYCATCDGNFFRNKVVAIVGGGNNALDDALYLSDIAEKVYLIHRRDEFKGDEKYINELKEKINVQFIFNSNIIKINGTDKLESIEIKDNQGQETLINLNGLFIAVGQEPKNSIFSNIINLDKSGFIETKDGVHTNIDGIYVAGDARVKELRQLTTAVSDGAIAATIAIKEMK